MTRAGYVLTGGASRRMGRDKALLPYRGTVLAGWVAAVVEEAAGSVSLVGGGAKYVHLGYPVIEESHGGMGPLSGIEAALSRGAEWSLITACDMAELESGRLRELLEIAERGDAQAVYGCGGNGRAEPLCAVYHRDCLPAVKEMLAAGELKATSLLRRINALAWTAGWVDQLRNINTPEDWEQAKDR